MKTSRVIARLAVLVLSIGIATAAPSPDVVLLLDELGANAGADLVRDLQAPDLIPASGNYRGIPIWNTGPEMPPGGSLAIVFPTAVRVGLALQELRADGVAFTETPTVERIMRVTTNWGQLIARPWFGTVTNALDAEVRRIVRERSSKDIAGRPRGGAAALPILERPGQDVINQALGRRLDLTDRLSVGEYTVAANYINLSELGPKP